MYELETNYGLEYEKNVRAVRIVLVLPPDMIIVELGCMNLKRITAWNRKRVLER
jgi:hypothetical protein